MGKALKVLLVVLLVCVLGALIMLDAGVDLQMMNGEDIAPALSASTAVQKSTQEDAHLRDINLLYANDDDLSIVTMYLTVSYGNAAENTNHTWEEINSYSAYDYEDMGVERYQIAGLLQVGDENGPLPGELGYGEVVPNATVQIRGQTSTRNAQKNYKIEIKQNKGLWNDQRTIALNKHMTDSMRFRNKLAYDLIEEIPQIMGLRTQFVHLYVKDTTGDHPEEFVDYGLYTQVEQLNSRALRAHGLDDSGHLYKVNFFEFYRYEDIIRLTTDPKYDHAAFESILETKGDTDHSKLIRMLEAVNNATISHEKLMAEYFDEENLLYWMAFQILMGNVDTNSRNMYIYSPLNSERWYIIPWDHDTSLMRRLEYQMNDFSDQGSWEIGVSCYWGNMLFRRCLKSADFRAKLHQTIEEMRLLLNEEKLATMIEGYKSVAKLYAFTEPDIMYIGITENEYDVIAAALPAEVENNYQLYLESLERPMPFFTGEPKQSTETGKLVLNWEPSFDFDAETITYTVQLARDYLYEDVIYSAEGLLFPQTECDMPEPGQYFLRVRATNEAGYTQDAFDYYVIDDGKVYGTLCFYVMLDGSIEVDMYEE